jgi:hypothetical protein
MILLPLPDRRSDAPAVEILGFEVAQEREVEQADAAVRAETAVVGVRVAGDDALAPDKTEVEAEHDLADAVALGSLSLTAWWS